MSVKENVSLVDTGHVGLMVTRQRQKDPHFEVTYDPTKSIDNVHKVPCTEGESFTGYQYLTAQPREADDWVVVKTGKKKKERG